MPSYGPDRLSDTEVDDLIRYLRTVAESAAAERRAAMTQARFIPSHSRS